MTSATLQLEAKLRAYPERLQRRLLQQALDNFPRGASPDLMVVFAAIQQWLARGVPAPTAVQSADGWHKIFAADDGPGAFIVEGAAGSRVISHLARLNRLPRPPRGVNLDLWRPKAGAAETRAAN